MSVAALKEQFEQLFPGKWLLRGDDKKTISTGLPEVDFGLAHGLARRRITEWVGPSSSGKTTLLRQVIAHWCQQGLQVVYIDTESKLLASDWAFVPGKFFVVRHDLKDLDKSGEKSEKSKTKRQDVLWIAEQLIRSNLFDVVIFDLVRSNLLSSRMYARLLRSLERSKTALVLLKEEDGLSGAGAQSNPPASNAWGCHLKLSFGWSNPVQYERGLTGISAITPTIKGNVVKDGLSKDMELSLTGHVPNRLFTHPQIPDRRAPKT